VVDVELLLVAEEDIVREHLGHRDTIDIAGLVDYVLAIFIIHILFEYESSRGDLKR
jgi:hypothetical protein